MALYAPALGRLRLGRSNLTPTAVAAVAVRAGDEADQAAPRSWLFPGADEVFRSIYTQLGAGVAETLAICSAIAGEGKTTIGLGLAITVAQDFPERRVLLVETDFERPSLAADFGVAGSPGLVDCLLDEYPVESCARSTALDNLHILPAGGPALRGGRVLRSSRMALALDTLRQQYDLVIVDLPPILINSDALPLTDFVDGVLLVVRAGVTPAPLVNKALGQLDERKLRGVVLNGGQSAIPGWVQRLLGR